MPAMTTAERRGYQQICGDDGAMMVIACDQRGGMRTLLAKTPEEQAKIGNDVLGLTKMDITAFWPVMPVAYWSTRSARCPTLWIRVCCIGRPDF